MKARLAREKNMIPEDALIQQIFGVFRRLCAGPVIARLSGLVSNPRPAAGCTRQRQPGTLPWQDVVDVGY